MDVDVLILRVAVALGFLGCVAAVPFYYSTALLVATLILAGMMIFLYKDEVEAVTDRRNNAKNLKQAEEQRRHQEQGSSHPGVSNKSWLQ